MRQLFFALFLLVFTGLHAQDTSYVRRMIDTLCAPRYHGRGYVNEGDIKAAHFIQRELKRLRTEAPVELLPFPVSINRFPGKHELKLDDKTLVVGQDYIADPNSCAVHGQFEVVTFKPKWADSREKIFELVADGKFDNAFVLMPEDDDHASYQSLLAELPSNPLKAAGYLKITNKKLTWRVGLTVLEAPIFEVDAAAVGRRVKSVNVALDQEFVPDYEGLNVMAMLPGNSDSTRKKIVFTAHLDHLGRMGADTYIPGASDNASGSAMLLDLYTYYKENRPKDDVVFIWFGGEEAGLVGSRYFVDNAPFPLSEIKFLLNLDLMGDAKTGITAVNGKVFDESFAKLSSLNLELALLEKVKARGPAANSDHHPFFEQGVPCFFIYTMGDYKHYHDIYDRPENLPLTKYNEVFRLITAFVETGI